MNRIIKIGTRSSELALWQANTVAEQLDYLGHKTEIVKIESLGDEVQDIPLYELGVTGVFTKSLDLALLKGEIDIAVHSLKDVPTQMPEGIVQVAVLKRGDSEDVLILKKDELFFENKTAIIATGSLRRKAQWLHRYPDHTIVGLRGNVNTRLQKLKDQNWDGAIFASAGLQRLKLLPKKHMHIPLDWMIPAPAQGAVMIAALEKNNDVVTICKELNDKETETCVSIEREFLRVLEGGCTAPIGAIATINEEKLSFKGVLFSPDGKKKITFNKESLVDQVGDLGTFAAEYILNRGGKRLMRAINTFQKDHNVLSTKVLAKHQKSLIVANISLDMRDFITIKYNRLKPILVKNIIENVIITSKNAIEALIQNFSKEDLKFTNIYCVGLRTKKLIESKIGPVAYKAGNADKLADYLIANKKGEEFTFFCGDLRRDELPKKLIDNNCIVNEIPSYFTHLSSKKIDSKYEGILFYSPSAIQSFIKENTTENRIAFCIGDTTANKAKKHFKTVIVSEKTTVDSVIDAVNSYYKNKDE